MAQRQLGGAAAWGVVLAAMGAGGVAGGLVATLVRPRRPIVVVAGCGAAFATPLSLLAAGVPVAALAAAALVAGAGMMLGSSVWESTLQRHVPAAALSRVGAYNWLGPLAAYPVGLALWGPVADAVGVRAALWLAFGLLVASALAPLAVPANRRVRGVG